MRPIDADAFWKILTGKCEEDWVDLMVVYELLEEMPTIEERKTGLWLETGECEFCLNHEIGDTLYEPSSWDGGVCYDYIRDIKYCPICGRKLRGEEHDRNRRLYNPTGDE